MTTAVTEDAQDQAAPQSLWRKIWEFPLFALIVALALVVAAVFATGAIIEAIGRDALSPAMQDVLPAVLVVGLVFAVMKLGVSRLGREPRDDLPLAIGPVHLALGLGLGFVIFALVVAVAAVLGVYRITGWGTLEGWLGVLMSAGVGAGFVEEVAFRGIIFRWVEELAGSWAALMVSALLFGFAHAGNDNATLFSSVAIAIEAGVLLGAAYMLTRSLWLAVGIHAGWNLTQGLVFDVAVSGFEMNGMVEAQMSGPDWLSGGAFGLEASVIALVIATSAGLVMLRMAAKRGEIVRPLWVKRDKPAALPA